MGDLLLWPRGQKDYGSVSGGTATTCDQTEGEISSGSTSASLVLWPVLLAQKQPGIIHLSEYCWVTDVVLHLSCCFTNERDGGDFGLQVVFHTPRVVELFLLHWCWNNVLSRVWSHLRLFGLMLLTYNPLFSSGLSVCVCGAGEALLRPVQSSADLLWRGERGGERLFCRLPDVTVLTVTAPLERLAMKQLCLNAPSECCEW